VVRVVPAGAGPVAVEDLDVGEHAPAFGEARDEFVPSLVLDGKVSSPVSGSYLKSVIEAAFRKATRV